MLANRKGGAGKSTTALNLAVAAEQEGERVIAVELDEQGSIAGWAEQRQAETPLYGIADGRTTFEGLLSAGNANGCTLAVIDTPGHASQNVETAIERADFVLIPIKPSLMDLNAVRPTVASAMQAKRPFGFVITQAPPQQARIMELVSALSETAPVAPVCLGQRMDYVDSIRDGLSVLELNPGGKASAEIRSLWKWVKEKING